MASGWPAGSRQRVLLETASLPTAASPARVCTAWSQTNRLSSALPHPARANRCACSGLSTIRALTVSWMSAPVRAIVPVISRASRSGTVVWRASMWTQDLMIMLVPALSARSSPKSACSGGHGLCSSFSAMHAVYLAGVPWVAWSSWCGRRPKALIAVSLMARPMVALARKPEPNTAPLRPPSRRTPSRRTPRPGSALPSAGASSPSANHAGRAEFHDQLKRNGIMCRQDNSRAY